MTTLADRLKALRNGTSTASFAKTTGISGSTWNNYERGVSVPTGKKLIQISERLGVSVEWLLHGKEPEGNKEGSSDALRTESQETSSAEKRYLDMLLETNIQFAFLLQSPSSLP